MAENITYLFVFLCGFIQFLFTSGTPVPSTNTQSTTSDPLLFCFQTHTPKGRYGPCENEQVNPDSINGSNEFNTAEECCRQAGMAGGYTENRSGSRCSTCADILEFQPSTTPGPQTNDTDAVVDGDWTSWDSWSECSCTCGNGTKTKTRTCTNPAPKNGGANCSGQSVKTNNCYEDPCIVDGAWSTWSDWSACSVTCEDGERIRQRSCNNPSPQNGGLDCEGTDQETIPCSGPNCPIHGGFSEWVEWGDCEGGAVHQCNGIGIKTRYRYCNNPVPKYGGNLCSGEFNQRETCRHTQMCPVNGGWGNWGEFSECSETCGISSRIRHRQCDNPAPINGGNECRGSDTDSETCSNLPACPTQPPATTPTGPNSSDCKDDDSNCEKGVFTESMTTDVIVTVTVLGETTKETPEDTTERTEGDDDNDEGEFSYSSQD